MKKILKEILNKEEAPKEIKSRLLDNARTYLLVKDLGGLFTSNVLEASIDIVETVSNGEKPKIKKQTK